MWFAQVLPKRLALQNSELFLQHANFLWPAIKLIGRLGLPDPAENLLWLCRRLTSSKHERHLRPSRESYYNTGFGLYGLAVDRHDMRAVFHDGGQVTITRRFLTCVLSPGVTEIQGSFEVPGYCITDPITQLCGVFVGQPSEKLTEISADLDLVFESMSAAGTGLSENLSHIWFNTFTSTVVNRPSPEVGQRISWSLIGDPLLESLIPEGSSPCPIFVLYTVEVEIEDGLNETSLFNHWVESHDLPCRRYSLAVETGEIGSEPRLGTIEKSSHGLMEEISFDDDTVSWSQNDRTLSVEFKYPVLGSKHKVTWDLHRSDVLSPFDSEPIYNHQTAGDVVMDQHRILRISTPARSPLLESTFREVDTVVDWENPEILEKAYNAALEKAEQALLVEKVARSKQSSQTDRIIASERSARIAAELRYEAHLESQLTRLRGIGATVGRWISRCFLIAAGVLLIAGVLLGLFLPNFPGELWLPVVVLVTTVLVLGTLANLVFGLHLVSISRRLEVFLAGFVERFLRRISGL